MSGFKRYTIVMASAVLALAGCASPTPQVRTVRVEIPVAVPCRTQSVAVPAFAAESLKRSDSLEEKVRALLADRRQRQAYEIKLLAAIKACQ